MAVVNEREHPVIPGFRFAILGLVSFIVVLGLTALWHEIFYFTEETSYLLALVIIFFVNFLGARYYVYKSLHAPITRQFALFFISSLGFRGGEFLGFLLLYALIGLQYLLAAALTMIASFVLKFLFFRSFVFVRM